MWPAQKGREAGKEEAIMPARLPYAGRSPSVPALPVDVAGLMAQRRSPIATTLNDHVETIHLALWPRDEYRASLDAVHDSEAVEGSISADNFVAALLIREY